MIDLLKHLEKLYLYDVTDIQFVADDINISLDTLEYLYLDNVSFKSNQEVKIITNNLIYFDLRFEDNYYDYKDYNFMGTMKDLINIFNFDFLSLFDSDININDDSNDIHEEFKKMKNLYKKPKEIFGNEIIKKLNYFYFEISYEYYIDPPPDFGFKFKYEYMFSKSINNNYIFETSFYNSNSSNNELLEYILIQKEYRISRNKNDNNNFFIDKDMVIGKGC